MWGVQRGEEPCWPVSSFGDRGPGSQSVSVCCWMPTWDGESFGGAGRVRSCRTLCNSAARQLLEALPGDTGHCRASDVN